MGHPKKLRKKYETPSHPWQKTRILEEKELTKEFGFKNKAEIWKVHSVLSRFKRKAKELSASPTEQSKKETEQLFARLKRLGLLTSEVSYDAVLEINVQDLAKRRLQSVLVEKGLARTPKQARQFITHKHVTVNGKAITSPSYLVTVEEENAVGFRQTSALDNEEHPERFIKEKEELAAEMEKIKPAKEESKEESTAPAEESAEAPAEEKAEEVKNE